jgi:hypothetical protein
MYLVDTYQALNGASAIAANGLLRYILGAAFPLFALQSKFYLRCNEFLHNAGLVDIFLVQCTMVLALPGLHLSLAS